MSSNPLVVTHGNGPHVGLLALQAAAYDGAEPYPLDLLGAETEGMIGYLLAQELRNAVSGRAAAIGALDEAALLLDGIHGTTVTAARRSCTPFDANGRERITQAKGTR